MDILQQSLEPLGKRIGALPEFYKRTSGVVALQRYNDVHVSASMQLVNFAKDGVDIAIRYGAGGYPEVVFEKLVTETLIPVRSPEFLRSSQPLQSARDLLGVTLLHDDSPDNDPSCPNWEMWLRAAGVNDIDAARCPRFNQPSLVIVSTILGHSIALAKSDLAAEDIIEIYR